jgi:hypothetical protein
VYHLDRYIAIPSASIFNEQNSLETKWFEIQSSTKKDIQIDMQPPKALVSSRTNVKPNPQ